MDLFSAAGARDRAARAPLPEQMRPRTLADVVGQTHLTGPEGVLGRMVARGHLRSIILFGPPGTGKTTIARVLASDTGLRFVPLSAVESGVADVRATVSAARQHWDLNGVGTLVFLDEIHRFSRSQQDVLLPHVEDGTVVLVGATAENPWATLNPALLSRCLPLEMKALSRTGIVQILTRALARRSEWLPNAEASAAALEDIADRSGGDARLSLTLLEWACWSMPGGVDRGPQLDALWAELPHYHDRAGDRHYDRASAFIKSMRGSDPDAALFWLGQLLAGGEDPRFVSRRIMIAAAEDVGMADPRALLVAVAAHQALEAVGLPEARIPLAEAVIYVATAPKSNAVVSALGALDAVIAQHGDAAVPMHLRDLSYRPDLRRAEDRSRYRYPHDAPGHFLPDRHLPPEVGAVSFYRPSDQGEEVDIAERLRGWNAARSAEPKPPT